MTRTCFSTVPPAFRPAFDIGITRFEMDSVGCRAERKLGGTVETPVRDQGGREGNLLPHNHLPPLVPPTGETACPTLDFMTVRGPQAHPDRAEAPAPHFGLRKRAKMLSKTRTQAFRCEGMLRLHESAGSQASHQSELAFRGRAGRPG